mmetsp:Transcript_8476/g.12514  ORF Transcript_8476/g.12514 Transcript_8476/m.12514 type:complete len:235 (+) Transcript_8476:44-748(+)
MPYYYDSEFGDYTIYVGEDKYENDDLIKYSWPEDIWFHVDNFSSAHLYLRKKDVDEEEILKNPMKLIEDVPKEVMEAMCQIVKDNSIKGRKEKSVRIVYTLASNLKKTKGMEAGQVSFYKENLRKYHRVGERDSKICNHYKKQREWKTIDLKKELEERIARQQAYINKKKREKKKEEDEEKERRKKIRDQKHYVGFFDDTKAQSNKKNVFEMEQSIEEKAESDDESFDSDEDFI